MQKPVLREVSQLGYEMGGDDSRAYVSNPNASPWSSTLS